VSRGLRLDPELPRTELHWLLDAVWPGCRVIEGGAARGDAPRLAALRALPSATQPRVLVPSHSRRAAAASLRQFNDGMTQLARLRRGAAAAVLRLAIEPSIGTRVDVVAVDVEKASVVMDELREVFGRPTLEIAVTVGEPLRPNRKPVLRVMTGGGRTLGYAKIGWNELTKRLVANEARSLRVMSASPPKSFRVPRVLHEADVADTRLTVLSPLPNPMWRRGRLGAAPPYQAVREVAFQHSVEERPLAGSEYERLVRERIGAIADRGRRSALARLFAAIVEGSAGGTILFGSWHGDWTPWNMARTGTGLSVWDWERSSGPVPVGMDPLHHRFAFTWQRGGDLERLAWDALRASRDVLVRLGVDVGQHRLVVRLYLFELLLRFELARDAALSVPQRMAELERFLETETSSER
jgi:hypothetical protein